MQAVRCFSSGGVDRGNRRHGTALGRVCAGRSKSCAGAGQFERMQQGSLMTNVIGQQQHQAGIEGMALRG